MGDVSELQQAKKWIKAVLAANDEITAVVSTRIYADQAGSPLIFPYILFNYLAGTDVQGLGTARQITKPLFQVRIVTDGPPDANARKVDKRIDDVLQAAVYQLSGDWYFTARREQPVDRHEFDKANNKHYYNLGGLYRLTIGRTT